MSQRIVVNRCYGGFGLSRAAAERLAALGCEAAIEAIKVDDARPASDFMKGYFGDVLNDNRSNPLLVKVVDELGKESWGSCAQLEVVEIPDGVDWEIDEYDGTEWIAEKHRRW